MCDVVVGNYSVRYQLTNDAGSPPITVYTSSTSVTLNGLVPNAVYSVSVATITLGGGDMSAFSATTTFTVTATAPPSSKHPLCHFSIYCNIITDITFLCVVHLIGSTSYYNQEYTGFICQWHSINSDVFCHTHLLCKLHAYSSVYTLPLKMHGVNVACALIAKCCFMGQVYYN